MSGEIKRRGLMLVLSSPSGAGKTTLSRMLLASDGGITMSISATTRAKRPNEVEAQDYFFMTPQQFECSAVAGDFLEHAMVFEHRYGTPKTPVVEALRVGRDVLFDIDWQGTQQLKEKMRDDLVSIFVLPPSHDELERRLKTRAQDSAEVVAKRMAKAADESSHWPEYDYVIVNRDLRGAEAKVRAILEAERARRTRLIGVGEFVATLTK
ncbi:MAG: guanylate kinase [Proteobacteria bacterium]|nr:guanylate kinase [Pseudomonadota bacterium]